MNASPLLPCLVTDCHTHGETAARRPGNFWTLWGTERPRALWFILFGNIFPAVLLVPQSLINTSGQGHLYHQQGKKEHGWK